MAIHEDVPGVEATVRCHERPLPELEDPNAHDSDDGGSCPTVTKYIECVDDTEFGVSIVVDSTYHWGYRNHILVATVYIDGKHIRGSVIRERETRYGGLAIHQIKGKEVYSHSSGIWSLRKCKFAAVNTIDDAQKERVESDLKVAKTLGTIEVRITRAIEYGFKNKTHFSTDAKSGNFELAEKSLKGKAVSHGTSYGVCEAIPSPAWIDARDIVEDNGPILIFRFMYRSRDALRRELIIPRSPSRSPAFEDLTPAERDRLARERLNELRELREKKLKREDNGPMIKREFGEVFDLTQDPPVCRPTKKSRLQDGREVDVVDLTDD
ncbi:hypothetical protein F5Y12DRAFT_734314 [Xylaria sp. FL1777]|nr:hypothetical protein F5Y12DRAFT_734314 [Xylaria sp. FL1777]